LAPSIDDADVSQGLRDYHQAQLHDQEFITLYEAKLAELGVQLNPQNS